MEVEWEQYDAYAYWLRSRCNKTPAMRAVGGGDQVHQNFKGSENSNW